MLDLNKSDLGEFRDLWFQETGQLLTEQQARNYGTDLLELVSIVVDPSISKRTEPP